MRRVRTREERWRIGFQEIVLGDCLAGLKSLANGSIDVVVTSPPYNIGVAYRAYDDRRPRGEYLAWLGDIGRELARVLKPDGSLFLNVGSTSADPWTATDVAGAFRQTFQLQNQITWVKSLSIGENTVGHFKPITSRRFLNNNHESIFHFSKTGAVEIDRLAVGVPFKDKTNIARWGHSRDRRCAGNVWFIPYATVRSKAQKFDHPAGFPVELPERCLRLHGTADAMVLDPFLGAGSTLIAAARLGCRGLGFEIDRYYAEAAVERLSAAIASPVSTIGPNPAPQAPNRRRGALTPGDSTLRWKISGSPRLTAPMRGSVKAGFLRICTVILPRGALARQGDR